MSLEVGLVGLPNAGKSTLFNALTNAGAAVANYPFTTVDPNVGIATLADARLDALAEQAGLSKRVPAVLRVVDIAGLVEGAHRGEGLGNRFLHHIRQVDAIAQVVRCFEDPDVVHVFGTVDVRQDVELIQLELMLADLASVERRVERSRSAAKARPKEMAEELALLDALGAALEAGTPARAWADDKTKRALVDELFLLTGKPLLLVANVGEDALPGGGPLAEQVRVLAQELGAEVIMLCAQLEMELQDFPAEEAAEYLQSLGLDATGLNRFVRVCYRLLDLISFFTLVGKTQAQAWSIRRGATVLEAAGKIHTDMAKGFIRAEVTDTETMLRGDARARIEGRDYVVQDGDVITIKFRA